MAFDANALRAAMESARQKSTTGSNTTDMVLPPEQVDEQAAHPQVDLTTKYMGLTLPSPIVASAGPLSQTVEGIKSLEDAGVGAIVMFSLFEEQIRLEQAKAAAEMEMHAESFAEALSYFPTVPSNDSGLVTNYLRLVEYGAKSVNIPLIASLNSSVNGDWTKTTKQMAEAGAAGIELNIYFVAGDLSHDGREIEERYLEIVQSVKESISIPVALKLSPYFSSFGQMAKAFDMAGADALVLFNRWLQPDIDLNEMRYMPGFDLSTPAEGKLPRTWISALRDEVKCSLAGTGGVETYEDVVKYILSGADVVMTTAALVRHGSAYARELVDGLGSWLERNQLTLDKARGMLASPHGKEADLYARSGYVSGLEQAKRVYGRA